MGCPDSQWLVAANDQLFSRPLCSLEAVLSTPKEGCLLEVEDLRLLKARSLLTWDVRVGKRPGPGDCKRAAGAP